MWAEYDNMTIESEDNNYKLHVTGYHGNAGDAFNDDHAVGSPSNGMMFSTPDVDNDLYLEKNCASLRGAGWWFRRCSTSSPNGITVARARCCVLPLYLLCNKCNKKIVG